VAQQRLGRAQRQQLGHQFGVAAVVGRGPVQSSQVGVVLAVGVVVAALAVADLVARAQHGRALGQQQRGQQRAAHAARVALMAASSVGPSAPKLAHSSPSRPSRLSRRWRGCAWWRSSSGRPA
jgi:hypothetical protein